VQRLARRKGLLCREAFHYKEHPLAQALRALVASGRLGQLRHLAVRVLIPQWAFGGGDIRFSPRLAGAARGGGGVGWGAWPPMRRPAPCSATGPVAGVQRQRGAQLLLRPARPPEAKQQGRLGSHQAAAAGPPCHPHPSTPQPFTPGAGGTMMDAGCYCAHVLRFLPGSQPRVLGAWPHKLQDDWFIDREMKASVEYPGRPDGLTGALHASLAHSGWLPTADIKLVGSRWAAPGCCPPSCPGPCEAGTRSRCRRSRWAGGGGCGELVVELVVAAGNGSPSGHMGGAMGWCPGPAATCTPHPRCRRATLECRGFIMPSLGHVIKVGAWGAALSSRSIVQSLLLWGRPAAAAAAAAAPHATLAARAARQYAAVLLR
jgi:hypothetical protein